LKIAFRNAGDIILLLDGSVGAGSAVNGAREFSSSEYSKTIAGIVAGEPPSIDLSAEKRLIDCLVALAEAGTLNSAHDLSDGGLAVGLGESCFAGGFGARIAVPGNNPAEFEIFNERGARAIISVTPENLAAVLEVAKNNVVATSEIGKVTSDKTLRIEYKGYTTVTSVLPALQDVWAHGLERALKIR
jgi:phosphoribosylformylglycinamidine synthase